MFANKKIVMVIPERLGDTLMCTPAIHYLKHYYPSAIIDVIALSPLAAETLKNNPDIQQILVTPKLKLVKKLIGYYDIGINIHDGPQAREYFQLLQVPTEHIPPRSQQIHQAEQALLFMQNLLPKHPRILQRRYRLFPPAEDFIYISKSLQEHGVDLQKDKLVGCHVGCHSIAKRRYKFWRKPEHPKAWPVEYVIELAEKLLAADPHFRLVITGSKSEQVLGKKITKSQPHTINLINQTSVTQLSALMKYLNVYVTPDTGLLHVACSTDVPLIALFGPTNLQLTGPYPISENITLLQKNTMLEITPEEVFQTVLQKKPLKK